MIPSADRRGIGAVRRLLKRAAVLLGAAVMLVYPAGAQQQASTGRIVGRVIDAASGKGVADVGVRVVGTTSGTQSGPDGRFTVTNVAAGSVALQVRRLGYQVKTVTGLQVNPGAAVEQNVTLEPATAMLAATVVTASSERGSVSAALDQQRTATGIVNTVTAEQIQRSPDANAAQAVQRVSGVTIQDNKYVLVRGLGERYTTTSLNGARVPSAEPERKVVPLDLFPAGLLQTVTTSKTFTPDQPGDFAGASVDIRTREYPAQRTTTYAWTAGYNTAATGQSMLGAPTVGGEWLGFAGSARALPGVVAAQSTNFSSLSRPQVNSLVRAFRPVWSPVQRTAAPNVSLSASTGGTAGVAGKDVGYLFSGSYGTSNEVQRGEVRALAVPNRTGTGGQEPYNRFVGETGRSSILWGGMANFSTLLGQRSLLAFDNLYNRTADNEARADTGYLEQGGIDSPARRTTLRFVERTVRSSQLRLEQTLSPRQTLWLAVTSAGVVRDEPDRGDFVQVRPTDPRTGAIGPYQWLSTSDDAAKRSFSSLDERSWNYSGDYRLQLGSDGREWSFKTGGAFRDTRRDARNRNYSIFGRNLTDAQLQLAPEQLFSGAFVADTSNVFFPAANATTGSYRAVDRVGAGYLMADVPLAWRARMITGARVEDWHLTLTEELPLVGDPSTPPLHNTDVLPSIAVNVALSDAQNLRLSAARTVSRPEYREVSALGFCDVIGERCTRGNPALRRAMIDNYDLRWELYPSAGEVLSVGTFAKRFHDPIERIEIGTSGSSAFSFVNTKGATNVGLELEMRTRLGRITNMMEPFTTFANATFMRSRIEVGNEDISALTNTVRPMAGQSPYVVNAGVSWEREKGGSATLLYNVVGSRIVAVGSKPVEDTYELPRQALDFSAQAPLRSGMLLRVNAKNLFDAPTRQTSGTVTRLEYRTGRVFQLGLTWQQ